MGRRIPTAREVDRAEAVRRRAAEAAKAEIERDRAGILAALAARGFDVSGAIWAGPGYDREYGELYLRTGDPDPVFSVRVHVYGSGRGNPPRRFEAALGAGLSLGAIWTKRHPTAEKAIDAVIRRACLEIRDEQRRIGAIADVLKKRKDPGRRSSVSRRR